jgi:hypothetical protein
MAHAVIAPTLLLVQSAGEPLDFTHAPVGDTQD